MSFVHTAFGRGQIVGEETVRGRKQYLVAGNGFKLWVDEADAQIHTGAADFDFEPAEDVNEENSTDLPYNPEPQFPVEGFSDEQTIQPNHELDADDRLSPADSLTFDEVGDREYPGPAEHLFARRTAAGFDYSPPIDPDEFLDFCKHYGLDPEDPESEEAFNDDNFEHTLSIGREGATDRDRYRNKAYSESRDRGRREHEDQDFISWRDQQVDPEDIRHGEMPRTGGFAGLSDKYIEITADADHYNDPVQRFRDDPIREINRVAHSLSDVHDDDRMDHYAALVDSDPMLREAAWSDVRQKAQRIRREGKMDVHDIDNNQIYATVHGDHGDYDVMIVKGGLGGNSITQWTCTCDWGRHAFKRKVLHVGRLCSHGLAGWLEMQSQELSDVAKKHPYKKRAAHDEVTLEDLIGPPYEEDHGRVPASRPRREIDPELAELLDEDYLREHGYRIADVIDDYKKFNDEYNDGHVDKATADNFISRPHQAGGIEPMEPEDVDKLYNYVEDNKTQPGRRNYEVPYSLDPDKSYKKAEVLRTSPHSLTPDLKFVPEGEDSHFVDVEEDERETTGPDQIVHFSSRYASDEEYKLVEDEDPTMDPDFEDAPGEYTKMRSIDDPGGQKYRAVPPEIAQALRRRFDGGSASVYHPDKPGVILQDIENFWDGPREVKVLDNGDLEYTCPYNGRSDRFNAHGYYDDNGQLKPWGRDASRRYAGEEVDPEPYRDFSGGGELLNELREESSTPLEEDFGNMRDRNDDVREIVEELREKGYDADQFVASRKAWREPEPGMGFSHSDGDLLNYYRRHKNPDIAAELWDRADSDLETLGYSDLAGELEQRGVKRPKGRSASYGVGNQGAGPGGAFGQPGGGNWADEPFAGSGPDPKLWYESSEDYVDAHERPRYEDVTDLGDDDIIKYTEKPQQGKKANSVRRKQGAAIHDFERFLQSAEYAGEYLEDPVGDFLNQAGNDYSDEELDKLYDFATQKFGSRKGSEDPIEAFYKSGAADAIKGGGSSRGGGSFSDDAIAANAQSFLMRTAGRNYSLAEQRELEDEEHHLGARNLDGLDLAGTHYISDL